MKVSETVAGCVSVVMRGKTVNGGRNYVSGDRQRRECKQKYA